jgi:hypothetical protein
MVTPPDTPGVPPLTASLFAFGLNANPLIFGKSQSNVFSNLPSATE